MNNAHAVGSPLVGVVLSGGGARGIAHVGILRVLEELKIPVDFIGGTSFGAVIASLYASGYDSYEIEEIIKNVDWNNIFSSALERQEYYFYTRYAEEGNLFKVRFKDWKLMLPSSIYGYQNIYEYLSYYLTRANYLSSGNFMKLPIPLFISTTDIVHGENRIFTSGDLIQIVQASMAFPLLLSPVPIDTSLYVDGGITNNLPISGMKEMGAEIIIASNVTGYLKPVQELGSPMSVAEQSISIMMNKNIEDELREADIVFRPEVEHIGSHEFHELEELIARGKQAAEEKKPGLHALIPSSSRSLDSGIKARVRNVSDFNTIVITGNTIFPEEELLSFCDTVDADTTMIHQHIEELYIQNGYNLAYVYKMFPASDTLFVEINEGRIEAIRVAGNELTNNFVIQRELTTQVGDAFNIDKVQDDVRRLYGTNYFDLVTFSLEPTATGNVALTFNVQEKPFGIIEGGAAYGTEDHASAFLSIGHENIFGTGNAINFYARFGKERRFGLNLATDRIATTNLNNSLQLFFQEYTEVSQDRSWNMLMHTGFFDDKRLGMMSLVFDFASPDLSFDEHSSGIGLELIFDNLDVRPYPSEGLYRKASYTNFNKIFGSTNDFQKITFQNEFYTTFWNRFTFANKIDLVINSSEGNNIPYIHLVRERPDGTFFGYHNREIVSEDIFYISLQMRALIKEFSMQDPRQKLFFTAKAGIGDYGNIGDMDEFWEIFEKGENFGFAVGLEMPTLVGPVELFYEKSAGKGFWNLSIGYEF
jgi:predicted acylesterase/phospholipase RssA